MALIKSITEVKKLQPFLRAQKSDNIIKKNGENTIVLFDDGSTYTAYGASAVLLYNRIGLPIYYVPNTLINAHITTNYDGIDFAILKKDDDYMYFPRLVRMGFKIAII